MIDFLIKSNPYIKQGFCICHYPNQSIIIHTHEGEYKEEYPKTLAHFLASGNTGWYALSETPFGNPKAINGQTSLEMELEKDYLFLKKVHASKEQTLHLLLQLKPYGPTKEKHLLAAQKRQFELTTSGTVSSLVDTLEQDKQVMKAIAKSATLTKNEINETKLRLDKQSKNFEIAISKFLQLIVNKLEQKYKVSIRFGKTFIEALKNYNDTFDELEANLENHIQIELNLALIQGNSEITLTPTHLASLSSTRAKTVQNNSPDIQLGRFAKTYKLLDRYETAAELVQDKNLPIIGKHIGSHCVPSVSNASITDALNKQAKKVFELFEKYPDKWPIIRSEFKSVANVVSKELSRRRNMA